MCDWHGEIDVPHTLTSHNASRHLNTALLTDDALVPDTFIFATEALEVLRRSEDTFAKEPVRLGTLGPVVDRLGLGHLSPRPSEDILGTRDGECNCIEGISRRRHRKVGSKR